MVLHAHTRRVVLISDFGLVSSDGRLVLAPINPRGKILPDSPLTVKDDIENAIFTNALGPQQNSCPPL